MVRTLGLGGDGDEVDAIERVERRFAIRFGKDDCERFVTVGDVWCALLDRLRLDEQKATPHWAALVAALGEETLASDEAAGVGRETLLLQVPARRRMSEAVRRLFRP
jgi:hypothetical protein